MKKDNLLDKIQYLDKIFNDLSLRNEIKDQDEIHQIVNKYNPNLNIILPRLKPQDLFYLFVNYSGDVENEEGPLISYIYRKYFQIPNVFDKCGKMIKSFIGNELFSNPNTFDECAEKIARFIWCSVFNTDNCQFNHNELKSHFKQELNRQTSRISNKNDLKNLDLMKSAIFVLNISPHLSSTAYKFYYNDITFLKTNWKKDFDFIQQYPSFVYWLIKHHEYADKLQNIYSSASFNENCLPFWLFSLRLMLSLNCIMIDIDSSTTISKIINKAIIECIKKQIDSNNLSKLGTDWLSLVLSNVPSEFIVHNYHIFYEFFCRLCEDETNSHMLYDYKKTCINNFTKNICEMVFDKKTDEFLEKPFER